MRIPDQLKTTKMISLAFEKSQIARENVLALRCFLVLHKH